MCRKEEAAASQRSGPSLLSSREDGDSVSTTELLGDRRDLVRFIQMLNRVQDAVSREHCSDLQIGMLDPQEGRFGLHARQRKRPAEGRGRANGQPFVTHEGRHMRLRSAMGERGRDSTIACGVVRDATSKEKSPRSSVASRSQTAQVKHWSFQRALQNGGEKAVRSMSGTIRVDLFSRTQRWHEGRKLAPEVR